MESEGVGTTPASVVTERTSVDPRTPAAVLAFLASIGGECSRADYGPRIIGEGFDSLDGLQDLDEQVLVDLGVPVGHAYI